MAKSRWAVRSNSLRGRLALRVGLAVGWVLLLGGMGAYPLVRHFLISEFDYALRAKARALVRLPQPERVGVNLNFIEADLPEYQAASGSEYFQVWLRDGTVLARSPSLGGGDLPYPAAQAGTQLWTITLAGDIRARAVGLRLFPESDESQVEEGPAEFSLAMTFARDLAPVDHAMRGVFVGMVVGALVLMAITVVLVRGSIRAGLEPVRELARAVQDIGAATLHTRLPVDGTPDELKPVVNEFNDLLERMDQALRRERRFTADVAHELLTPVTELRALAEAAQTWRDDPEATATVSSDALEIAGQMQAIVEALLALTRSEAGHQVIQPEPVDLAAILLEMRSKCADKIGSRQLQASWMIHGEAVAQTDRAMLRSMLHNLLENAVEYCVEGGRLSCVLEEKENALELVITNTNRDITPQDLPRLCQPLWRKDTARTDRTHAGLGLALVASFAKALGCHLGLALTDQADLSVRLFIPKGQARPAV